MALDNYSIKDEYAIQSIGEILHIFDVAIRQMRTVPNKCDEEWREWVDKQLTTVLERLVSEIRRSEAWWQEFSKDTAEHKRLGISNE